jgi:hypothetical protein
MKSTVSTDSEKGPSGPTYGWKSRSTSTSEIQGPVTKMAPPAHSPDTIFQGRTSHIRSLAKYLFRPHRKTGSTTSLTHLLTPVPPSRSHSPTSSLDRSESSSSILRVGEPIVPASVLDAELAVPPEAIQKSTHPLPRLNHLTIDLPPQHSLNSTSLSPPPRGKRSRISRDLPPILESPTMSIVPFLEVTLCSPTTSPTADGVGSLINMYLSRHSTMSVELPPFPDTAGHRDSSASLPLSGPEDPVSPTTRLPAVDHPVVVPPEGVGLLKTAVSIGAVGGKPTRTHPPCPHPELPPVHATSPAESADMSQYSDSEADARASSEESAETNASAQSGASREGPSRSLVQDRPSLRALPLPSSRPALSHAQSGQLHKSPPSSSRYGYL